LLDDWLDGVDGMAAIVSDDVAGVLVTVSGPSKRVEDAYQASWLTPFPFAC